LPRFLNGIFKVLIKAFLAYIYITYTFYI